MSMILDSPRLAPAGPPPIFPDEPLNSAANFDTSAAGGKATISGGVIQFTGMTSGQNVKLASGPNAAMMAQLTSGVQYDVTVQCTARAAGSISMSLLGGTASVVASAVGTFTTTITAGSSVTEAWRCAGSGNPVSGNAQLTITSVVIVPH